MRVGTKSVLIGAHWPLHPLFVARAWHKLYGWKTVEDIYVGSVSLKSWRLWICFFVHDIGYWHKPNMDGPEGEAHPEVGARIMEGFNRPRKLSVPSGDWQKWDLFCLYHSRYYSRKDGKRYSLLCVADKLSISLEPWWLYIPRTTLTGEIREYMFQRYKYEGEPGTIAPTTSRRAWFKEVTRYMHDWAWEHRDGRADTWTPDKEVEKQMFHGTRQ